MRASLPLFAPAVLALGAPLLAQDICEGNGLGDPYIETTSAVIGDGISVDLGSPTHPLSITFLSLSGGFGPTVSPVAGLVCLDVFSPLYTVIVLPTDGTGNVHLDVGLANEPALYSIPPLYANAATIEGVTIPLSKTVPVFFEFGDSYSPTGAMSRERLGHRATFLGQDPRDNRITVLVSGGADGGTITAPTGVTATTEIWSPLDRTFTAGPTMSSERSVHTATLLQDGRVLLAGGVRSDGTVTSSADLYDPVAKTISAAAPMSAPRVGHTATLLQDGRVLVTGGLADYQNPSTAFKEALATAQTTGEVYDPVADTWTSVANTMQSKRTGHGAVLRPDGRVLVVSGINGGIDTGGGADAPTFTTTCDYYDPGTNLFSAAPAIPSPRGFFGISTLASGSVLVTGGTITGGAFGEALATNSCYAFNGAVWFLTGSLTKAVAFHAQTALRDGTALVVGGHEGGLSPLVGSTMSGVHDGTTFTAGNALGTNPTGLPGAAASPRGAHSATRLHDGSVLVLGGGHTVDIFSTPSQYATGFVYTP